MPRGKLTDPTTAFPRSRVEDTLEVRLSLISQSVLPLCNQRRQVQMWHMQAIQTIKDHCACGECAQAQVGAYEHS